MAKFIDLSGIANTLTQLSIRAHGQTKSPISGVDLQNWPSAMQPVQPVGPPDSQPLGFSFWAGQNLNFTPRVDALYDADTLRTLSTYPLARILIENTKDQLCQIPWSIELRQKPGETIGDIKARRRKDMAGDVNVGKLSRFFEYPNREQNWQEWLRPILEDMLVIDAPTVLLGRDSQGRIGELRAIDGASITRYITDQGFTPDPPSPAYAQVYPNKGIPRVQLTTDQLIYKPRNIVPRVPIASYLYGLSPTESIADEIKVGISRLAYILAFYEKGSLGNVIHIVPPGVNPDKIREAMQFANSMLSGNIEQRRMWTMLQGFREEKDDQVIIPKEPVLADVFDDVHIRKLAYAYGASPQRLQKPMNRASAQSAQQATVEEDLKPFMNWVRMLINYIIHVKMGMEDYSIEFNLYSDPDLVRQAQSDERDVKNGIRTRNEVRADRGLDPDSNPLSDKLCVTLANSVTELGMVFTGDGTIAADEPPPPEPAPTAPKPKVNGKASMAGLREVPRA